ncbi:MAG TPA: PKD domain-containing protein [Solirubrobacteraceae bacterium]|nr:PKD domain-containing protein [Solirubrobacteraceae bacterium]HME04434.1 PKD domain-containing protein [Solirubrobacteraceae bacterium]
MTTIARSHPLSRSERARSSRALITTASLACLILSLLLLAAASPAGAVVTEVESTKVGLQPRNGERLGTTGANPETFANENGNVVLHGTNEYAIYWDPEVWYEHEWVTEIDGFFQVLNEGEGGAPVDDVSQYRDRSNAITPFHSIFKGAYSDTAKFPAAGCTDPNPFVLGAVTCLTDVQLREQLQSFIAAHSLPKGLGSVYYLLTPPGVTVCLDAAGTHCSDYKLSAKEEGERKRGSTSYKDSFCSYHGAINPDKAVEGDGNTIVYAAIPWSAGTLNLHYLALNPLYEEAFDCQDGGFNPEKHGEKREKAKQRTEEEEKQFEKETEEQKAEALKIRRLEEPHQEEPNQGTIEQEGHLTTGLFDLIVNQIAVEEMNTITDPLLNGWQDGSGNEATDLCRNVFAATAGPEGGSIVGTATANPETEAGTLSNVSLGARRYYLQNIFSAGNLHGGECAGGIGLVARFTAPNPVNAGETIGVDGMESTVSLFAAKAFGPSGPPTTTYATFSWNFGDGTPEVKGYAPGAPVCEFPWLTPCAASVFHSYQYGGTYKVTLKITDVGGNTTSVSHELTVNGPPPPGSEAGSGGSGSGSSSGATGSAAPAGGGSSSNPGGTAAVASPVAAAAVVSHTLRAAMKTGVVVAYSVNEQVAGHFEVLLSRALAHRLHITGPAAVGLPAGSPASIVVAKALIITTAGGRSTVKLFFSKRTALRLAHERKVSFLLRLVVRNASSMHPTSSTVLSSFTLTH